MLCIRRVENMTMHFDRATWASRGEGVSIGATQVFRYFNFLWRKRESKDDNLKVTVILYDVMQTRKWKQSKRVWGRGSGTTVDQTEMRSDIFPVVTSTKESTSTLRRYGTIEVPTATEGSPYLSWAHHKGVLNSPLTSTIEVANLHTSLRHNSTKDTKASNDIAN
jgi:hypothetical protein